MKSMEPFIFFKPTITLSNSFPIIDEDIWNAEIVSFHPNINTETVELTHENLERFYNSLKMKKET